MYLDAIVAMIIYTIVTAAFYLLGASILYGNEDIPSGNQLIETLANIYTQTLGENARLAFISGAFFVLFSSVFAAPPSGITYGANGIWPWLREGEEIENHGPSGGTHTWRESIDFDGSQQIGYLHEFINGFDWTELRPANQLLVEQPGEKVFNHFIAIIANEDRSTVSVYTPVKQVINLRSLDLHNYKIQWYNPISNSYIDGKLEQSGSTFKVENSLDQDMVLVLEKIQ